MEKCKWRKCKEVGTSLVVAQWLRIALAVQGVQVLSLGWEQRAHRLWDK